MTETGPPRISVGIPVYNGAQLLPRALDALLGQDIEDFEVVISDNASTDRTEEVCARYAALDPRIRYYRNAENEGLARNFNRVFERARGEYFKWASHDDWVAPSFLRECAEALDADPASVLCAPSVVIVDGTGRRVGDWHPVTDLRAPEAWVRMHRLLWSLGEPHALYGLMRASALRKTRLLGGFLGADRVLLAELCLLGGIHQLPCDLHYYTVDQGVRTGRRYSRINDPATRHRVPLRTWRLWGEHERLVLRSNLTLRDKALLVADVSARFGLKDARRLAAETYHAARSLAREPATLAVAVAAVGVAALADLCPST